MTEIRLPDVPLKVQMPRCPGVVTLPLTDDPPGLIVPVISTTSYAVSVTVPVLVLFGSTITV